MKSILALVVLAVIATVSHSAVIQEPIQEVEAINIQEVEAINIQEVEAINDSSPTSRANLNVGYINVGDRLLYRGTVYRARVANAIQYEDRIFRGAAGTRISAIQAIENGATQYASAAIRAGGINANNVTIRFTSARGWGYSYTYSIWGR